MRTPNLVCPEKGLLTGYYLFAQGSWVGKGEANRSTLITKPSYQLYNDVRAIILTSSWLLKVTGACRMYVYSTYREARA